MNPLAEAYNLPTLESAFYSSEVKGYDQPLQQRAVCEFLLFIHSFFFFALYRM